jgi:hypothetical protein
MPGSPHRQQPQLQVDTLERAGCYRVVTETASGGAATARPVLDLVLDQLRLGDTWSSGSWTGWAGLERQNR